MNKLITIVGPTATGKTALGIKLAKKFGGEIVSADSRQVYKGMDIGTGKDLPINSKPQNTKYKILDTKYKSKEHWFGYYLFDKVPVWLLDIVKPDYRFSVADYVRCADLVIKDIWQRKKMPILVGGTGFYIKALIDGIETIGVKPDKKLREKLRNLEIEKLREILKRTCPERMRRMNESDRRNPRRLIRAIEITQSRSFKTINHKPLIINHLFIGLTAPNKILYERIDKRVEKRVKQGIVHEIESLLKKGYSWENSVLGETIGYKEWKQYFETLNTKYQILDTKDIIQKWKYNEHAYARRQMTWFKKNKRIIWFNITLRGFEKKVEKKVKNWLQS